MSERTAVVDRRDASLVMWPPRERRFARMARAANVARRRGLGVGIGTRPAERRHFR